MCLVYLVEAFINVSRWFHQYLWRLMTSSYTWHVSLTCTMTSSSVIGTNEITVTRWWKPLPGKLNTPWICKMKVIWFENELSWRMFSNLFRHFYPQFGFVSKSVYGACFMIKILRLDTKIVRLTELLRLTIILKNMTNKKDHNIAKTRLMLG